MQYNGLIDRYRRFMPISEGEAIITLYEGATPLHEAYRLAKVIGATERGITVYLKFEGLNPTGSFKDRGMTMAVTRAYNDGAKAIICASTGNTSASAAAYAANCGIDAFVLIPEGKIALGKLSQAMLYGARIIQVRGNFDQALTIVRKISESSPIALVNSVNPDRLQGQKSAAFEVVDELGFVPDYHALPVGNAGNISAYWMGYTEYMNEGITNRRPSMLGFQAAGAAPFVVGHPIDNPETIATAIRIGKPASWDKAIAARDESGGVIDAVTDDEILEAYGLLARNEGVFCEPASAASVAGVMKMIQAGKIREGSKIVCTLTGNGLKDPDTAISQGGKPVTVDAEEGAVLKAIGL
ncbi:MAG: threonine synthase [Alphaproteobacteria bacterium CG_4_10_14_0_2_um_filter_63_37]|nr:MAG: threonine synthase [Proteobacteria bacterium CG1_02_64_396]PJA25159.1 MAG: threonine synthase [Alphaproteobacteria bacterium CG_4_10_14_0_2_um_filter_63_37]